MLFQSPEFLLFFLPVVLAGLFLIGSFGRPLPAMLWLVAASLIYYGWWRLDFLPLLLGSIAFNYVVGLELTRRPRRWLLALGIAADLGALGWFKYSGFLVEVFDQATGADLPVPQVALPLAISFYTFTQIAYLVDAHGGAAGERSPLRYALFVLFFPQLIAGPIVHHSEMLPQFQRSETYRPRFPTLILGLTGFAIGLFKKVFIADPLGPVAALAFGPAAEGLAPNFVDTWAGAIAYTLRLYFDFSGYSDMAIGLALMMGLRLPINFASPYKAASIIEFWARWHMTLTRFLTAYVYNPLVVTLTRRRVAAGKPTLSRAHPQAVPFLVLLAVPTLITMLLAGVWHGAGWTFIVFGLFHGLMLVVNHAWRALRRVWGVRRSFGGLGRAGGILLTFIGVTVSFVFFRAGDMIQALTVLRGMSGFGGEVVHVVPIGALDPNAMEPARYLLWRLLSVQGLQLVGGLAIIWLLPNTAEYIERIAGGVERRVEAARALFPWPLLRRWGEALVPGRPTFAQGTVIGLLLALGLLRALSVRPAEFIYFTF